MQNVTVICSMLHEAPAMHPDSPREDAPFALNSATRMFRGEPVLSWTIKRLCQSQRIGNIALLCWEDQLPPVEEIAEEHHAYVLAKGPRRRVASIDAVSAARRWSDGWRGGLLSSCDFDLGFHGEWIHELAQKMESDAVVLVDPAAALVDPAMIDAIIAHASERPQIELCFTQSPPGLGGVLLKPAMLEKLSSTPLHPGRVVHYMPEAPARDPIGSEMCFPIATPIARSSRSFKLDSQRQVQRIAHASQSLNGTLMGSDSQQVVQRMQWATEIDELPREITIELNTARLSKPIFSPVKHLPIARGEGATIDDWKKILLEAAAADDLRLTIGGAGDPLESPLLFPLIDAAKSAGARAIHVMTDLLCEDRNRIEQLAVSEIDVVSVSIPAMTVETYAAVMGVDGLQRVLENIAHLITVRGQRGVGVPLVVPTFAKCAQNLAEMEAWYDQWLRALGCAVIDGPSTYAGQIPDFGLADMSPPMRKPCLRLNSRVMILCDGSVVPCEMDVLGRASIGNIRESSLRDLWQKRLAPLRAVHASGNWCRHSLCAGCRDWNRP